jgi:hypothetical protein
MGNDAFHNKCTELRTLAMGGVDSLIFLKDKSKTLFLHFKDLTGGRLIEFHLIESVDRIFRSNA